MAERPRYGTPNFEMLQTWFGRQPNNDGPFWALNLMKYREVADYKGADGPAISGREADDVYVPRGPLAAIGALIVFGCDVEHQADGTPIWDRIGIVRYPTRVAFLEMQSRDDFKKQHVHKEAGMQETIVMSCLVDPTVPPAATPAGTIVLRVARLAVGARLADVVGATRLATFDVEGVILGDGSTWTHAAFDVAPNADVLAALLAPQPEAEASYPMQLGNVVVDRLLESIETAPAHGATA